MLVNERTFLKDFLSRFVKIIPHSSPFITLGLCKPGNTALYCGEAISGKCDVTRHISGECDVTRHRQHLETKKVFFFLIVVFFLRCYILSIFVLLLVELPDVERL